MIEVKTKYHVGNCQFDDINEANDYMRTLKEKEEERIKLLALKEKRREKLIKMNNELNEEMKQYNKDYNVSFVPYYTFDSRFGIFSGVTDIE